MSHTTSIEDAQGNPVLIVNHNGDWSGEATVEIPRDACKSASVGQDAIELSLPGWAVLELALLVADSRVRSALDSALTIMHADARRPAGKAAVDAHGNALGRSAAAAVRDLAPGAEGQRLIESEQGRQSTRAACSRDAFGFCQYGNLLRRLVEVLGPALDERRAFHPTEVGALYDLVGQARAETERARKG